MTRMRRSSRASSCWSARGIACSPPSMAARHFRSSVTSSSNLSSLTMFMPQMNCEELVRAIRNIDSDVQIILETGYSGEKPPRHDVQLLDIQGYHDKLDAGVHQRCAGVNTAARGHRLIHLGDDPLVNMRRRRTNEDPAGL